MVGHGLGTCIILIMNASHHSNAKSRGAPTTSCLSRRTSRGMVRRTSGRTRSGVLRNKVSLPHMAPPDKMPLCSRLCLMFSETSTCVPTLLPTALQPRQARGICQKKHSTKPSVRGNLSPNMRCLALPHCKWFLTFRIPEIGISCLLQREITSAVRTYSYALFTSCAVCNA